MSSPFDLLRDTSRFSSYLPLGVREKHVQETKEWKRELLTLVEADESGLIPEQRFARYEELITRFRFLSEHRIANWEDEEDLNFHRTILRRLSDHLMASEKSSLSLATRVCFELVGWLKSFRWRFEISPWTKDGAQRRLKVIEDLGVFVPHEWVYSELCKKFYTSYRRPVTSGVKQKEEWNKELVQLADECAWYWDASKVGALIVSHMERDLTERISTRVYAHVRLLHLMTNNDFCHQIAKDGRLLRWWETKQPSSSTVWDTMWLAILARGVKHGWAIGDPLLEAVEPCLPRILTNLSRYGLHIPMSNQKGSPVAVDEKVPGDFSHLFARRPSSKKAIATILVYLLSPVASQSDDSQRRPIMNILTDIFRIAAPYCHSATSIGKWEQSLASFVATVCGQYLKRVGRERSSLISDKAGRYSDGTCYRLGPVEDQILVDTCLPMALQGLMKRQDDAAHQYESAIVDLCAICPYRAVKMTSERLIKLQENIAEPFSLIVTLKVCSRMSRQLVLYDPSMISRLFSMVETGIDISEPLKSLTLLSFYLALMNFLPSAAAENADFYGFDFHTLRSVYTPMFGYKTTENKDLFEAFFQKAPYFSLLNYPNERLTDKYQSVLVEGPDVREKPGHYEQAPIGYQTAEEIANMIAERVEVSRQMPSWALAFISKLLENLARMTNGEEAIEESFTASLRGLILCIVTDASPDLTEQLTDLFLTWAMKEPRSSVQKLAESIAMALASSKSVDVLGMALKRIGPVMLAGDRLNAKTGRGMVEWAGGILQSLVAISYSEYTMKHMDILVKICWALLHSGSDKIFRCGLKVSANIIDNLTADNVEVQRCDLSNPNKIILEWVLPRWLKLTADGRSPATFEMQSLEPEWHIATDEEIDTAICLAARVNFGYMVKLFKRAHLSDSTLQFSATDCEVEMFKVAEKKRDFCLAQIDDDLEAADKDEQVSEKARCFYRSCKIFKKTLQAFAASFPRESTADSSITPTYRMTHRKVGDVLLQTSRNFVIDFAKKYVGVTLDAKTFSFEISEDQSDNFGDMETTKVMSHLLKISYQALTRPCLKPYSADRLKDMTMWKTYDNWANPVSKVHGLALMSTVGQNCFIERVEHEWYLRTESNREDFPFEGARKELSLYTLAHCTYLYADVRSLAQDHLFDIVSRHRGSRIIVLEHAVREFEASTAAAREHAKSTAPPTIKHTIPLVVGADNTDKPGSSVSADEAAAAPPAVSDVPMEDLAERVRRNVALSEIGRRGSFTSGVSGKKTMNEGTEATASLGEDETLDVVAQGAVTGDEKMVSLLHVKQSGLIYILGESSFVPRIVSDSQWRATVLLAIVDRLSVPLEVPTLKQRLLVLARVITERRNRDPNDEMNKALLKALISRLKDSSIHWRAQTIGLAFLISHLQPESLVGEEAVSDGVAETLAFFADYRVHSPLITSLACTGIVVFLKMMLTKQIPMTEGTVRSLTAESVCANVFGSVPAMHVQLVKGTQKLDYIYNVVVDVVRLERTWPSTQVLKLWKNMSLHCCFVGQTYTQFIARSKSPQKAVEMIENVFVPMAEEWTKHAITDEEHHSAVAELSGGIMRASRLWQPAEFLRIFELIAPIASKSLSAHPPEETPMWIDTFRYALHGIFSSTKRPSEHPVGSPNVHLFPYHQEYINGCVNLLIHGEGKIDALKPLDFDLVHEADKVNDTTGSGKSQSDRRIIRRVVGLIQDLNGLSPQLSEMTASLLMRPEVLRYPYKKVREEIARAISRVLTSASRQKRSWTELGFSEDHPVVQRSKRTLEQWKELLSARMPTYVDIIKYDHTNFAELGPTVKRPLEINEIKTVSAISQIINLNVLEVSASSWDSQLLPLMYQCIKHPDDEISQSGSHFLNYLHASVILPFHPEVAKQCRAYMFELWPQADQLERNAILKLAELYITKHRLVHLLGSEEMMQMSDLIRKGFEDPQINVHTSAWRAFGTLAATMPHHQCQRWAQEFFDIAGPPNGSGEYKLARLGALVGLSSLIATCETDVPFWLPHVVTRFALHANKKASDLVRTLIERRLQDFFNGHLKDWQSEFQYKFTEQQIDILNEYRGRPIYFA